MKQYDLVVIGGGPAGYVPAIRAAQMGRTVAVVEDDHIGGTCLNRGCIPTKTLVASAGLLRRAAEAKRFGLSGGLTFQWGDLVKRKDLVVKRLRKGIEGHLSSLGIDLVREHGILAGPGEVMAGGEVLPSRYILLSPGSLPLLPGPLAADGVETSREVLEWESLPSSLVIVGGGVIGCEFASIFSSLGVRVTIIEMLPHILPGIDDDVRQVVARSLERSGVKLYTGSPAASVDVGSNNASVTLASGTAVQADRLLAAVGRRPRVSEMGLEQAGVELTGSGIVTDDSGLTSLPGVYAAGDATGKWQLAHAGSAQALAAVDHMFGSGTRKVNPDAMPGCIFTSPEIAVVGPGQEEWEKRGVRVRTGISRYIANGRAVGMNETEGFVKLVAREEDDVVVGVQIVGADAGSLVGEAVIAVNAGVKARELGEMIHPHPTLSELFMEAGEDLGPGALHG